MEGRPMPESCHGAGEEAVPMLRESYRSPAMALSGEEDRS
jgi:hypothetical protein